VAIDPFQATRFSGCGLQFLEDAGVSGLVEHRAERSEVALPRLLGEGRTFDLAFVDGDHRFDGVFVDLFYLGRLVRPGGVVFLDDYQLPAVERAASFFLANLCWKLEEVRRRTTCTAGPCFARPSPQTRGPTTTSSTSEARPSPRVFVGRDPRFQCLRTPAGRSLEHAYLLHGRRC
jgi:hypothetical protein